MTKMFLALPLLALLPACGPFTPQADCTSELAQSTVSGIVREALERATVGDIRNDAGARMLGMTKIRAALAEVTIALSDIRTTKEDPNSSRRSCSGTLRLRFPDAQITRAETLRTTMGSSPLADAAAELDLKRVGMGFTGAIDFTVQPTDDGQKLFAETESGNPLIGFGAEVIAMGLLQDFMDKGRRIAEQENAVQAAEQKKAEGEQRVAALESAKVDNQLAWQTIRATWGTLDKATRTQLQPVQTAWTRKTDADCRVEAAAAAIHPSEREAAHLSCSTRMIQERIGWLNGMRRDDPAATTAPAVAIREPAAAPAPADDL